MKPMLQNNQNSFQKILRNSWADVCSGAPRTLICSATDTAAFRSAATGFIAEAAEQIYLADHHISHDAVHPPCHPFMEIIPDFCKLYDQNPWTLVQSDCVYPPLKPLFASFIEGIPALRKDYIFLDEISFEKSKFRQSLFDLLAALSLIRPIVVVLSGIRNAGPELLEFLKFLQEKQRNPEGDRARILCVCAYSPQYGLEDEASLERWDSFIGFTEQKEGVFGIESSSGTGDEQLEEQNLMPLNMIVDHAMRNLSFLACEEALTCCEEAEKSLGLVNPDDAPAMQRKITEIRALSLYYLGRYSEALIAYHSLVEAAQRQDKPALLAKTYIQTAMVYLQKGDVDSAIRFLSILQKLQEEQKDRNLSRDTLYLSLVISLKTSQPISESDYFTLMNSLKADGFEGLYAFVCANVHLYAHYYRSFKNVISVCNEAISYYALIQNEMGLSFAYHKAGIMFSNHGNFREALIYMNKTLHIREAGGNTEGVIRIQNGIGYLYYLQGKYSQALSCFQKSISLLNALDKHEETCITLYNIGMLYFTCAQYEKGAAIADKLLQLMQTLRVDIIPYHKKYDVYILKALCIAKLGKTAKAFELIARLRPGHRDYPWKTRFYYKLLRGIVAADEGDMEDASHHFQTARVCLEGGEDAGTDSLPILEYEYARAWLVNGNPEKAHERIKAGLSDASGKETEFLRERLETLRETGRETPPTLCLPETSVNTGTMINLAKKEFLLNRLQTKIRDIHFLNILQSELNQTADRTSAARKLTRLIKYQFPMEVILFLSVTPGPDGTLVPGKLIAWSCPAGLEPEELQPLIAAILSVPKKQTFGSEEIHQAAPDNSVPIRNAVSLAIMEHGIPAACLFMASANASLILPPEDMETLRFATAHIGTLFTKIRHNEDLFRLSREDSLTGLYNRQALQTQLQEEEKRLSTPDLYPPPGLSIVFIDLDNFKYYNDSFGHALGDILLTEFAKLVKHSFRDIDFAARYGGDEFIILMPDTDAEIAALPAERLFNAIEKEQWFLPRIAEYLRRPVAIAEELRLSCSIGIASSSNNGAQRRTPEELVKLADNALYQAKKTGKHKIVICRESDNYSSL